MILKITASKNAANETTFNIVDQDENPVDLIALGATVVTVEVCGIVCVGSTIIDSDGDYVSFSGDTVTVQFGKLSLAAQSQPYYPKISYRTSPTSGEEIIAGRDFKTSIQLKMVC